MKHLERHSKTVSQLSPAQLERTKTAAQKVQYSELTGLNTELNSELKIEFSSGLSTELNWLLALSSALS